MKIAITLMALAPVALVASASTAAYQVTQSAAPAPTYSTTLNFDEAGGPTGNVSSTHWTASLGITIQTGVNVNQVPVSNVSGSFPWINTGNVAAGSFGNIIHFSTPISSFSFQGWGNAGAPSPIGGGGFQVFVTDANGNPIDGNIYTPAWGGVGNSWYNITTTGGSTISHLYINNNSNIGTAGYIDNLSWNAVPTPGALALLGLAGVIGGRRRRN